MLQNYRQRIDEFWPDYVGEHSNATNRQLHFIGNTNLLLWIGLAFIRRRPALLIWAVVSSYALAWIGHFFFQRNVPATFRYPVLAGVCNLIMYAKMWRGEMQAEVVKYARDF